MGTIADKLTYLNDTKTAIKDAIVAKGVTVADGDTFRSYAGKIGSIGETVDKTKFGASIDNIVGNVVDGLYLPPKTGFIFNLAGVVEIRGEKRLQFLNKTGISEFYAEDLKTIQASAFENQFYDCTNLTKAVFGLEEITASRAFSTAFPLSHVSGIFGNDYGFLFPKLRKIAANSCFYSAFGVYDDIRPYFFPVLTEISGTSCFRNAKKVYFPEVVNIIGGTSSSNTTFYVSTLYPEGKIFLPKATSLSGQVFNRYEAHFSIKNREIIEALPDYVNSFGVDTTIYFDLVSTITVNGTSYNRNDVNSIYGNSSGRLEWAAWIDDNNNIVYTDATAEPAVGTVVYSDTGTTQIGTVEAII